MRSMTHLPPDTTTAVEERADRQVLSQRIPRYHVVLFDDNDHTYEYVVEMLTKLFRHAQATAWRMARQVESRPNSSAVKYTTTAQIGGCPGARARCRPPSSRPTECTVQHGPWPISPTCFTRLYKEMHTC